MLFVLQTAFGSHQVVWKSSRCLLHTTQARMLTDSLVVAPSVDHLFQSVVRFGVDTDMLGLVDTKQRSRDTGCVIQQIPEHWDNDLCDHLVPPAQLHLVVVGAVLRSRNLASDASFGGACLCTPWGICPPCVYASMSSNVAEINTHALR